MSFFHRYPSRHPTFPHCNSELDIRRDGSSFTWDQPVGMAVGMNSDRYRCSLTARDPKPVSHVCVSVAGFRSQCLFNQNCTVCLSPVDNNNNKVVSAFCPFSTATPSPAQLFDIVTVNRLFPEITGKDNLAMFSYSGRVKSPEWRRQLRRADLRQF